MCKLTAIEHSYFVMFEKFQGNVDIQKYFVECWVHQHFQKFDVFNIILGWTLNHSDMCTISCSHLASDDLITHCGMYSSLLKAIWLWSVYCFMALHCLYVATHVSDHAIA